MITKLKLKNWKSHKNSEFKFIPGTNVIVGPMGSGKSSLLQAISFALFGTFSELKKKELKISELITRGETPQIAEIELEIIQSKKFVIKRKIDIPKGSNEAVVRDENGALIAGPNPTAANKFVKELLKIDEDIFMRTVYSVQNDIDLILKFSPKERKQRIDELMGLHKFDIARDNCVSLRNQLLRQKKETETFLNSLNPSEIISQLKMINAEIEELKSKSLQLTEEIQKKKIEFEKAEQELKIIRERAERVSRLEGRLNELKKQLADVEKKLAGKKLEKEQAEIREEIEHIKRLVAEKQAIKSQFSARISVIQEELLSSEKKRGILEEKIKEIKEKLEKIRKLRDKLSELKISDLLAELSVLKQEVEKEKEERQKKLIQLKTLREQLSELEAAGSECPVCRRELAPRVREALISEIKKEISELIYQTTELGERLEKLERKKTQLEELFDENRATVDYIAKEDELLREYKELSEELTNADNQKEKNKSQLNELNMKIEKIEKEIDELREKENELNSIFYLYELKEEKNRICKEIETLSLEVERERKVSKDLEKIEKNYQRLMTGLKELETTANNFKALLLEKERRKEDLLSRKERVIELKTKISQLENQIQFLEKFKVALEAAQLSLRDELILAVNEVMGNVWLEIYPYEKWVGVRLFATENDYILQLKESGGDWVPVVGFASGGERMLAALAVRIAFARVLAPNLSLLILDEPTHNLDENAIKTLIEVIQTRVSEFLDQIFIVTHEEKLAETADNIIRL